MAEADNNYVTNYELFVVAATLQNPQTLIHETPTYQLQIYGTPVTNFSETHLIAVRAMTDAFTELVESLVIDGNYEAVIAVHPELASQL